MMNLDELAAEMLGAACKELLKKFREDDSPHDFVKLVIDESLGDVFTFILYDREADCSWERKNWYKQEDMSAITNPISSLKYIGRKIMPHIIKQDGITRLEQAKDIFILTGPLLQFDEQAKSDDIVVDGTKYTLQVRLNAVQKEFNWRSIPTQWKQAAIVTNKIIELNNMVY